MKRSCISLMALSAVAAGVLLPFEAPTADASFMFSAPVQVPNINTTSCDGSPSITADGLELYFVSTHPYGGDLCHSQIWVVTRPTIEDPWGAPKKLDPPVNSGAVAAGPCISADGLELYFYSGRNFLFAGDCQDPLGGYGLTDLWVSKRATRQAPWGVPQNLGPAVNSMYSEMDPSISSDGLSLYFASYRDMTSSGIIFDLYVTTRPTKNDPWGNAVRLPAPIPFAGNQFTPFISPEGLSLYFSQSPNSVSYDVYVSRRASITAPWEAPVPFTPVNSSLSEYALAFAPGSSTIYFARSSNWSPMGSYPPTIGTYDIWQIEATPIADFNGDAKVDEKDFQILSQHWGQAYSPYDIGPRPLGDGVVDVQDLIVFLESMAGGEIVLSPRPHASDAPPDAILAWTSPPFAKTHDVYFGTSFVDVNSASRSNPKGVLVSQGQTATTYDPKVLLSPGRTYYWRIDEIGGAPDFAICRGPVLNFKTEALGYPIAGVIATASSAQRSMGPEKTIDGSGLTGDLHGTESTTMWLSTGVAPNWIQYQFDKVYKLHELWVWNSNQPIESFLGFGVKKMTIEYSVDGTTWTPLTDVPEFARAPGAAGCTPNTFVSFGGVMAKYVKLTVDSTWSGMMVTGLSEVRFFYLPE